MPVSAGFQFLRYMCACPRAVSACLLAASLSFLAACGGGGSGGGSAAAPPLAQPPPARGYGTRPPVSGLAEPAQPSNDERNPYFTHSQFQRNFGLRLINADFLYASGEKNRALDYGSGNGQGVIVGIVDSGVDHTHPIFAGRVHAASSLTYALPSRPSDIPGEQIVDEKTPATLRVTAGSSERDTIARYPTYNCGTPNTEDCVRVLQRANGARRELPTTIFGRCAGGGLPPCADGNSSNTRNEDYLRHGTAIASILVGGRLDAPAQLTNPSSSPGMISRQPVAPPGAAYNHGVAYESQLLVYALRVSQRTDELRGSDAGDLGTSAAVFGRAFAFHNARRSAVVNVSLYPTTPLNDAREARMIRDSDLLRILGQPTVAPWQRTLYVFAAGNCQNCFGRSSPFLWGALPVEFSAELRGHYQDDDKRNHILSVVSLDSSGRIASGSRGCHEAVEFCLAAPGANIWAAEPMRHFSGVSGPQTSLRSVSGTSFAAPHVAGALAALESYFGAQLGRDELVARLLATANKTGRYSDAEIYGQGLLDLAEAARVQGGINLPLGQHVAGQSYEAAASGLQIGAAYGDALERALAGRWLMGLDEMSAPFALPLAAFVDSSVGGGLGRAYAALQENLVRRDYASGSVRLSLLAGEELSSSVSSSERRDAYHLSAPLGNGAGRLVSGYGVHAALGFAPQESSNMLPHVRAHFLPSWAGWGKGAHMGAAWQGWHAVAWRGEDGYGEDEGFADDKNSVWGVLGGLQHGTTGRWQGTWQAGFVQERGARAASTGAGAFGVRGSHDSWFAGTVQRVRLRQNWHALASAYMGYMPPRRMSGSLLAASDGLVLSQFAAALVGADVWRRSDSLSFYVAQPLRVEQGGLRLSLPQARTAAREVVRQPFRLGLVPSGRELEWGAQYRAETLHGAWLVGAALVQEAGHRRAAAPEARVMLQYRTYF